MQVTLTRCTCRPSRLRAHSSPLLRARLTSSARFRRRSSVMLVGKGSSGTGGGPNNEAASCMRVKPQTFPWFMTNSMASNRGSRSCVRMTASSHGSDAGGGTSSTPHVPSRSIGGETTTRRRRCPLENGKPTIAQWSVFLPLRGPRSPAGERPYCLTRRALVTAEFCPRDCFSRSKLTTLLSPSYCWARVPYCRGPGSFLSGSRGF